MTTTTSAAMDAALGIIRTHEVTYHYRPMPREVNRPRPIARRDLTPVYSHGLLAGTVAALERRHLARLSPIDNNHGRVLPAEE